MAIVTMSKAERTVWAHVVGAELVRLLGTRTSASHDQAELDKIMRAARSLADRAVLAFRKTGTEIKNADRARGKKVTANGQ